MGLGGYITPDLKAGEGLCPPPQCEVIVINFWLRAQCYFQWRFCFTHIQVFCVLEYICFTIIVSIFIGPYTQQVWATPTLRDNLLSVVKHDNFVKFFWVRLFCISIFTGTSGVKSTYLLSTNNGKTNSTLGIHQKYWQGTKPASAKIEKCFFLLINHVNRTLLLGYCYETKKGHPVECIVLLTLTREKRFL